MCCFFNFDQFAITKISWKCPWSIKTSTPYHIMFNVLLATYQTFPQVTSFEFYSSALHLSYFFCFICTAPGPACLAAKPLLIIIVCQSYSKVLQNRCCGRIGLLYTGRTDFIVNSVHLHTLGIEICGWRAEQ